jgi:hypothetical protein
MKARVLICFLYYFKLLKILGIIYTGRSNFSLAKKYFYQVALPKAITIQ